MNLKIEEKISDKPLEKKLIALEMSLNLRDKVRKEAFDMDMSISATIRMILERYFAQKEKHSEDAKLGEDK